MITGVPVLFGLLLPIVQLIYWSILTYEKTLNFNLLWIAAQSFGIAIVTTCLIIITSVALIYFSKWNYLKELLIVKKIATIGYVIPGAIIGIGIIRSSQSIINFFDNAIGMQIGFIFYGSSIAVSYTHLRAHET